MTTTASDEIGRYVSAVYADGDIVEVRRLPSTRSTWHRADELSSMATFLTGDNESNQNIFVGANPRKNNGTTGEDVALARCVFADFDNGSTAESVNDLFNQLTVPRPTMMIHSGHGVHCYWRLTEPLIDLACWTRLQGGLISRLGTDPVIKDPARIMRLPGFFNRKNEPVPCRIIQSDPSLLHDYQSLMAVFPEPAPAQTVVGPPICPSHGAPPGTIRRARAYLAKLRPAVSGQGGHNQTFQAALALVRGFCMSHDQAYPLLAEYSQRCLPPWSKRELDHKLDSAANATVPAGYLLWPVGVPAAGSDGGHLRYAATDQGNGQRFAAAVEGHVRYCHPWGQWLVYDGQRWVVDLTGCVNAHAKDVAVSILTEAAAEADAARRLELAKWATKSQSAERHKAMLGMAKSEPGIPVLPGDLDQNVWLLNVRNGTIDLRTGNLRPHNPEEMLTLMAPVDYDPQAECPTWERVVGEAMAGREDLVEYLQRAMGLSLVGEVVEHVLFVCSGSGANGKSLVLNAIRDILGDYAMQARSELLVATHNGNEHPTAQADLCGRRFVVANEVDTGRRFAEAQVKALTGGDSIRARRMNEDFWEFRPSHTIWLATNHRPQVHGTDHGIWRRIKLIPFDVTIPPERQDRTLPARLRQEFAGILAWMVRGCLGWQASGLGEAREVIEATACYRCEMDLLADFIAEQCEVGPDYHDSAGNLYRSYQAWCEGAGERPIGQRELGQQLRQRGFSQRRTSTSRNWVGLRVRGQADDSDDA